MKRKPLKSDCHHEFMMISNAKLLRYTRNAVSFANTVDRKNCVSFIDRHGSTYKYSKKSNTLAIITKQGVVVTFFKPKDGYNYFLREKERNQR